MKKVLIKSLSLIAALMLFIGAPVCVYADSSYTYTYDYWEEYQECPDTYTVSSVITSSDLGLETKLKNPSGLYVYGDKIYLCDSGNNRILELARTSVSSLEVVRIIDSFTGDVEVTTFSNPTDLAISEEGEFFICDQGNSRILKLDADLNYMLQFDKPTDSAIDENLVFQPDKIVIDTAGRVYCTATGINKGLVKYEADGTFSGFVGATPVTYDAWDYIWKKFASQEQLAQMVSFVPTEYDNIYIDSEGFIYATIGTADSDDIKSESVDAVRKLNLLGNDILVRNGDYPAYGDLYMGSGGGYTGASRFMDITVFDNDVYVCMDQNRGRIFAYNDQGRLIYAFGGNGNMDGYFKRPVAIEHLGYDLFVLDQLNCSITIFIPTDFGSAIYEAIDLFDQGEYDAAGDAWQEVMDYDGNFALAYIGIGRSLLRQKQYKEAMEYFKLKYDADNYSKAFKQYRKEWVEENIGYIVLIIVLAFLIPFTISKFKSLKREIDTADIFRK